MGVSTLFSHEPHVVVHDFTEFSINAKHFPLFEGMSKKPTLFCGPAKNLRGPAVENHCSKQTCISLTHSVCTKCAFAKTKLSIDYHYGSAAKLRNTCRCSLTQRLFRWSSPVVHKVLFETQTRGRRVKKWVAPRWSKQELRISNVTTACMCLSVAYILEKRVDHWH